MNFTKFFYKNFAFDKKWFRFVIDIDDRMFVEYKYKTSDSVYCFNVALLDYYDFVIKYAIFTKVSYKVIDE